MRTVLGCLICEADAKKSKVAKDILLWKIKASVKGVDGAVFRQFLITDLDDKLRKKHEEEIEAEKKKAVAEALAKAAAAPPRGGILGMFV